MSQQYERDAVGFLVGHPCPHCDAALYLSPEMEAKGQAPICLNACDLPVWQYRIMQQGLREAQAHTARLMGRGFVAEQHKRVLPCEEEGAAGREIDQ